MKRPESSVAVRAACHPPEVQEEQLVAQNKDERHD